jgi:hypothetical protein
MDCFVKYPEPIVLFVWDIMKFKNGPQRLWVEKRRGFRYIQIIALSISHQYGMGSDQTKNMETLRIG